MTWRESIRKQIESVVERLGDADEKTLRCALSDAYPFGERKHLPYKVWCEEVKRQLTGRGMTARYKTRQGELFAGGAA
jgi:hypothetical protein